MTGVGDLVAGRYRLRSQLGGGGMGAVWLARDELLGRDVAVKQVLVPAGISPEQAAANREAAMREGRIAARLSHPHAVSVYDMVLDGGQPWLVMEYLPSRSLAALLHDRGVLPVPQVAQIGAQVADALTATHAAGVVHRDVKPGNILIGEGPGREGVVKITDFGISRATGDVSLTQTGVVKGTPAFLAPEVAQGQSPDEASDVFSLGATLYACLEGTPPFGLSDNALQMLHRVAGGEFTPPRHAGALNAPLMRMLAPDPADRPAMPQVRDQLARVAAGPDRDVTEVLTARTQLPRTLPGMPARAEVRPAPPVTPAPAAPPPPRRPVRTAVEPPAAPPEEQAAAAVADERPPREPTRPAPRLADPPTATPPAAPAAASSGAASAVGTDGPSSSGRRRWIAVVAALVLLAAVAGLLVVLTNRSGDPATGASGSPSASVPAAAPSSAAPSSAALSSAAPSSAAPSSEPAATTAPTTTPATTTVAAASTSAAPSAPVEPVTGPPTAQQARDAVTSYYGLLPGNPAAAWQRTGPTLRSVEPYDSYIAFWNRFSSVILGPVTARDGSFVVNAPVTFVDKDGTESPEQHTITLVRGDDGRLLIDSDR